MPGRPNCRDGAISNCGIHNNTELQQNRIRQAKFPVVKSLDSFEFLAVPSLSKKLVLELALGLCAGQGGHRVCLTTAAARSWRTSKYALSG